MLLEKMNDFFTNRIEEYEEQMLTRVEGCREAYGMLPTLIPKGCKHLLDLGCGTGLELEKVFLEFPDIQVTGVDLTQSMLDQLKEKYAEKSLHLICGSYFDVEFEDQFFDCAISFQTMHHFSHEAKIGLYKKIFRFLKPGGVYIECDYMVETQEEEDFDYMEYNRIINEMHISEGEFYHYDTPCTMDNQIMMLKAAGFVGVTKKFRMGNTTLMIASK